VPKEVPQVLSQIPAPLPTKKEVPLIWNDCLIEIYSSGGNGIERNPPCSRTERGSQARRRTSERMLATAWPAGRILFQKNWEILYNTGPKKCFRNQRIHQEIDRGRLTYAIDEMREKSPQNSSAEGSHCSASQLTERTTLERARFRFQRLCKPPL